MTTRLSLKEYRETLTKQNRLADLVLANVTGRNERLKSHGWSDQELGKIPNEDLAKLAYEQSDTLPKEFGSRETFLAYWRGLRRKLGAPASPVYAKTHGQVRGDETRPLGQQIKQAWDASPGHAQSSQTASRPTAPSSVPRAAAGFEPCFGRVTGPQSKCA